MFLLKFKYNTCTGQQQGLGVDSTFTDHKARQRRRGFDQLPRKECTAGWQTQEEYFTKPCQKSTACTGYQSSTPFTSVIFPKPLLIIQIIPNWCPLSKWMQKQGMLCSKFNLTAHEQKHMCQRKQKLPQTQRTVLTTGRHSSHKFTPSCFLRPTPFAQVRSHP